MLSFGVFQLDGPARRLLRNGREIHLRPKAFELLALLVEAAPRLVPKRELHDRLWPGGVVADATLVALVKELRRALDADEQASVIRTVHRVGYAIDASVRRAVPLFSTHWLTGSAGERLPLVEGENVVGRDLETHVLLNHATVSRRHARIDVTNGSARLLDLGSKNGTSVGGRSVVDEVELRDGDLVCFGSVVLTYRNSSAVANTVS